MKNCRDCQKCYRYTDQGKSYVAGGNQYFFCDKCSDILDKLPTMEACYFVEPVEEHSILDDIIKARRKREKGISPWV
jgi:hypothetical protein